MPTFKIEVSEALSRVVEIEAKDANEAIDKINHQYYNDEIVLDYSDACGEAEFTNITENK